MLETNRKGYIGGQEEEIRSGFESIGIKNSSIQPSNIVNGFLVTLSEIEIQFSKYESESFTAQMLDMTKIFQRLP